MPTPRPTPRPTARLAARLTLLLLCIAAFAGTARAAEFPTQPVRIVVPFAPGGGTDLAARLIAERLAPVLGTQVLVDNRPGGNSVIATRAVATAAADGHTLLLTTDIHAINAAYAANLPYDALRDFAPVINLHRSIKALFVPGALPPRTLAEFVEYAKARPGVLNYATGGAGSSNHVDMELFRASAGIDLAHIPYNGPAAGIAAVASGEAQAMIVSVTTGIGAAQAGKVRALALFAAKRTPLLPDVPTAAEAGFGDVDLSAWIGLVAPAGTPSPIVERVNRELERVLREPASLAWADRQGLEIIGGSSASFAGTIDADRRRWAGVVKKLGIGAQ